MIFSLAKRSLQCVPLRLRKSLWLLQVIMLISALVELMGVVSIGPFIALAINPKFYEASGFLSYFYSVLDRPDPKVFLAILGAGFSGVVVCSNALILYSQVKMQKFTKNIGAEISSQLYVFYLNKDYQFHMESRPSTLMSRVGSDVDRFCNKLIVSILQINSSVFSIIVLLALMLLVNHLAAIVIGVILIAVYILVYAYSNGVLKKNGRILTEISREKIKVLQESFGGIKSIIFYDLSRFYVDRFKRVIIKDGEAKVSDKLIKDLPYFTIESVAFVLMVVVVVVFFGDSESVDKTMSELAIICLAGYRVIPKFQQAYRALATIKTVQSVVEDIQDDLQVSFGYHAEKNSFAYNMLSKDEDASFNLKNVSYSYRSGKPVLRGVNFQLSRGEVVGIIGESGAGKSTLMLIMIGIIQADSGHVGYGDIDINEKNIKEWRSIIGYVDSETFIFDSSILDNLTLFDQPVDEGFLKQVMKVSCLDQVVDELDEGLETQIGMRGVKLSSGQVQRIGFARALYKRPRFLFLDEATNALDYDTQQEILNNIRAYGLEMGIVVISHRLDMHNNFDRSYFLRAGVLGNC